MPERHPLLEAVAPLLDRLDARFVDVAEMAEDDVPLRWEGETVGAVRLGPGPRNGDPTGDLGQLIDQLAEELGGPLADLSRAEKQRAVRVLEERGAFAYRKSAETIADALGVSRFTVYNYLNRSR